MSFSKKVDINSGYVPENMKTGAIFVDGWEELQRRYGRISVNGKSG